MVTVAFRIEELVANEPGMTEAQLSQTIFGDEGYQQRVNSNCRRLIAAGKIERSGDGGRLDPYKYRLAGGKRLAKTPPEPRKSKK